MSTYGPEFYQNLFARARAHNKKLGLDTVVMEQEQPKAWTEFSSVEEAVEAVRGLNKDAQ